jgi:preprotein translocase subunit SecA
MITSLFTKIFGSRNERLIKQYNKIVKQINALESDWTALSDAALTAKTAEFRQRLGQGETLHALIPEAFATVREGARRVMGMRHYDVQLLGGLVLNDGNIPEMRTGEGKTLVATLAAYLNALPQKGVHVITVNDYLARRDAEWMSKLYGFLGLTTGVIASGMDASAKKQAYAADITYGTNNEFGFDYLRDNMAFSKDQRMQRGHAYAIVDEVDSILIDEARTPLIISGPTQDKSALYSLINQIVPRLVAQQGTLDKEGQPSEDYVEGDFVIERKDKQVLLTERGHEQVEALMIELKILPEGSNLYDANNIRLMHHVTAALRAHHLFEKNVDYIIENDEIVIIDEFTGRKMTGRRWSEGLHQAVEAKEGVPIQNENQTLASITFQNYFRLYEKLSGMTGTADTEAREFAEIYGLEVVIVPTHRPVARRDHPDLVYMSQGAKYQAIIEDIVACRASGQPVLVGTASIESSELLSQLLTQRKIAHEVLNAKQHEREAHIIAQAGQKGAVTIATNMAGRGTDIVLGGNWEFELSHDLSEAQRAEHKARWQIAHDEVLSLGGLHVIGTERHESRRIDNQLRGRSGRQGDPGSTRFYLSLDDSLMRLFASEKLKNMMQKLGMGEDEAIEHPWVTKAIENAQRKVEARNFDIRKQLLEYDNVANDQRKVVYSQRDELMSTEDISEVIGQMRDDVLQDFISRFIAPGSVSDVWDVAGLQEALQLEFSLNLPIAQWIAEDDDLYEENLRAKILEQAAAAYALKEAMVADPAALRHFEKAVLLQSLDNLWKEHLANMDSLRQGIHLRGYAQKNPVQEFKREAFEMFETFLDQLKAEVVRILMQVQIQAPEEAAAEIDQARASSQPSVSFHPEPDDPTHPDQDPGVSVSGKLQRVGRNDPCPCGSGKKFKQCCGKLA